MVKFVLGALVGAAGYKLWDEEKEYRAGAQKAKEDQPTQEPQGTKEPQGDTEVPTA